MTAHPAVLLLDLALVVALAWLFGRVAERLGQPAVIGEIVGGIALGPTLLPAQAGDVLFPAEVRGPLSALANIGVILFMFLVGCEFDRRAMRGQGWATTTIAFAATLVPFGLGVVLATGLGRWEPPGRHTEFMLFMGTAMAVTAFPVLSRVLRDRGMAGTPVGRQALASAAIGGALAWTLL
ncbi:cation:proton antiporter, partial [Streptosporangium algeriense]